MAPDTDSIISPAQEFTPDKSRDANRQSANLSGDEQVHVQVLIKFSKIRSPKVVNETLPFRNTFSL
jgi:hypothetical protein